MTPAEKLQSLGEGEVLDGEPLMKGIAPLPVECHVRKVSQQGAVTFDLLFMGVRLASAGGKAGSDGKIIWYEEKS
jgi:hypothetical protein